MKVVNYSLSLEEKRHNGIFRHGQSEGSRLNFMKASTGIAITPVTQFMETPLSEAVIDLAV